MAHASLDRVLSRRDLIVYGLLFIGPLAPVGVFGVIDARTVAVIAAARPLAHVVAGIWLAIGIVITRLRPTS